MRKARRTIRRAFLLCAPKVEVWVCEGIFEAASDRPADAGTGGAVTSVSQALTLDTYNR